MDNLPIIKNISEINTDEYEVKEINNDYKLKKYESMSYLNYFIDKTYFNKKTIWFLLTFKKLKNNPNVIDFDFNFCRQANDLIMNNFKIQKYIYNNVAFQGLIYHPKQLFNMYDNLNILQDNNNNLFVKLKNDYYYLSDFCDSIYQRDLDSFLCDFKIINLPRKINNKKILIILFWGNNNIGLEILRKITSFSFDFNLLIVVRNNIDFKFNKKFIIIKTKEYGNDIIPSIIGFNFAQKITNFEYVIKLQTKSEASWRNPLINFFCDKNLTTLENELHDKEFICHKKFRTKITDAVIDKKLFRNLNIDNSYFPAGSIFMSRKSKFNGILNFMENYGHLQYFLQNMYDTHLVLFRFSPIHFLERLVGVDLSDLKLNCLVKPSIKKIKKILFFQKNETDFKHKKKLIKKFIRPIFKNKLRNIKNQETKKNITDDIKENKNNKNNKNKIYIERKTQFLFNKKINIKKNTKETENEKENYYNTTTHFYGWKKIMNQINKINNKNYNLIVDNVEDYFLNKKSPVIKKSWLGFIHLPLDIPDKLVFYYHFFNTLIKNKNFNESLQECIGLISFSYKICYKLHQIFPEIDIYYLKHPITIPKEILKNFSDNNNFNFLDKNELLFLGQHLRRNYLMFNFVDDFEVKWLPGLKDNNLKMKIKVVNHECNLNKIKPDWNKIKIIYEEKDEDYISQLKTHLVIITTYCSNANNAILDIISLKIPALVEYNKSISEYLGEDYPGYFNVNNLKNILFDKNELSEKIKKSFIYLNNNYDNLMSNLSFDKFINTVKYILKPKVLPFIFLEKNNIIKVDSEEKKKYFNKLNLNFKTIEYFGNYENFMNFNHYENIILLKNNTVLGKILDKKINLYKIENI